MPFRIFAAFAVLVFTFLISLSPAGAQIAPAHDDCAVDESNYRPGQKPNTAGLPDQSKKKKNKKDKDAVNACPGEDSGDDPQALGPPGGGGLLGAAGHTAPGVWGAPGEAP